MCSLHCRCTEGRKLKVSCVAKHPPQVYSCSWISCLSAPHSTSWSRLEFFFVLWACLERRDGPKVSIFFSWETGDFFSMDFCHVFFFGKMMMPWWKRKPQWILGFPIFQQRPQGMSKNSGRSCCPCLAALLSSCPVGWIDWDGTVKKKHPFLKGFTKGLWNLFNGVSWEDRGILTGL